jgi:glutathione S-transferase
MPTLYHWEPNAGSLEVLAALHERGVAYEGRYVDFLDRAIWREPFASATEVECNIEIEGPVLVTDGGFALTDSTFINLYLEDAYPERPLRPADAMSRWRMNVWARQIGEEFTPAVNALGCAKYLTPRLQRQAGLRDAIATLPGQERRDAWTVALEGHTAEALEDARRKLSQGLARAEAALGGGPYLLGAAISLADLCVFAQANALPKLAPELLAEAPRTKEWLERVRARDGVRAALALARASAPDECFAPGAEPSRWG